MGNIFLIMAVGGDIEAYEVKAAAENGNVISSLKSESPCYP